MVISSKDPVYSLNTVYFLSNIKHWIFFLSKQQVYTIIDVSTLTHERACKTPVNTYNGRTVIFHMIFKFHEI